jgi:hypothetical protein
MYHGQHRQGMVKPDIPYKTDKEGEFRHIIIVSPCVLFHPELSIFIVNYQGE